MKTTILRTASFFLAATALAVTTPACTADVHDNTLNVTDPKVTFDTDVDVSNVTAGESVPLTLHAENIYLVAPNETPPAAHEKDAGHFQIYLDDVNTTPILITIQEKVSVTIPANTPKGDHKLICRLHHHDGTPTTASMEIDFKVTVSGSVTVSSHDGGR